MKPILYSSWYLSFIDIVRFLTQIVIWSQTLFSWAEKKELSLIFIMLGDFNVLGIVHGMLLRYNQNWI